MLVKVTVEEALEIVKKTGLRVCKDKETRKPLARIQNENYSDYYAIKSKKVSGYITKILIDAKCKVNNFLLTNIIQRLEFEAEYESPEVETHLRIAKDEQEGIYYDLANEQRDCVHVNKEGWKIEPTPLAFRRYSHTFSQSLPITGGKLNDMFEFFNIRPEDRLLVMAWLVSCFIPEISHPILLVTGEKGSTKTTFTKMLRNLVDPSATYQTSIAQKMEDTLLVTSQNWCMSFDNVESLNPGVSEFLCKVVTGDVYAKRTLYTDDELTTMTIKRCILLNGISIPIQRTDLLNRIIWIEMPKMKDGERKGESELFEEFQKAKPKILGAIFSNLSQVLKVRPDVKSNDLHRLADFDLYGRSIAITMGKQESDFQYSMRQNTKKLNTFTITQDVVAQAVYTFMEQHEFAPWEGTATELLKILSHSINNKYTVMSRQWPQAPARLSEKLKSLEDELQSVGIHVMIGHDGIKRFIKLLPTTTDESKILQNISEISEIV